jgi:hypothetical protein
MIQGMEILLDRMKTHPEEFLRDYSGSLNKWDRLIDHYRHVLTNEEMKAYNNAKHELERQQFTSNVLETLLAEPSQLAPEITMFRTQGRDPWSAPALLADNYATTSGKLAVEIQKEQLEQIKQIMKDELQQATKKRSR